MSKVPSIKGSLLQGALRDLYTLVESGKLEESSLQEKLSTETFTAISRPIQAVLFYPLRVFDEVAELACEIEYGGTMEGHRKLGGRAAEALLKLGIYDQLSPKDHQSFGEGLINHISRLGNALYSFSRWSGRFIEIKDDGTIVAETRVDEAEPFSAWYPERVAGFIHRLVMSRPAPLTSKPIAAFDQRKKVAGGAEPAHTHEVVWERPTPDVIIWTSHTRPK